ncbi:hypothetical protein [Streptomyces olivaceoviridis]|uniref:hypothetical protein n=1 Tax=Streptomyces olivaceoviridis TaxID=1921 RepID=UPI0036A8A616
MTDENKKPSSLADNPPIELYGPDDEGWYSTRVYDWIALCPNLRDPDIRGYIVLRSLVIEKYKNPVRKLTLLDLCELIPSPTPGQPSSLTRVRGILHGLSAVGLVSTPEGGPVKTSSRASAAGKPIRIRVNDRPPAGYAGWRNTEDKLAHVVRLREEGAASEAGRKSDPGSEEDGSEEGAGRKSDPAGLKSDPRGSKSDPDAGADQQEADGPLVSSVGTSTGGQAPSARSAGDARRASTGSSVREAEGGCAASGKDGDSLSKQDDKPRPVTGSKNRGSKLRRKHTVAERAAALAVRQFFPQELAVPDIPAVTDAILAALAEGRPESRTVEQLGARIDRRWYVHGWARRLEAGEKIEQPVGVAIDLVRTYGRDDKWGCSNPRCEDGADVDTGEECRVCPERLADRKRDRKPSDSPSEPPAAPGRRTKGVAGFRECACRNPIPKGSDDHLCRDCRKQADYDQAASLTAVPRQPGPLDEASYGPPPF